MNDPLEPDQSDGDLFDPDPLEEAEVEAETKAPQPRDPTPSPPEPPSPSVNYADADPDLKATFWKLILLYKLSFIGLALGALLVAFETRPSSGGALFAGAAGLLAYTVYTTKRTKERLDAGEFDEEES